MNRKSIIVALIVSLVFSYILWKKIQQQQSAQVPLPLPVPQEIKKPVIVAKKRIPYKFKFEPANMDELFERKEINASDVPPDAFTDMASLTNKFAAGTIFAGDIMTEQRVLDKDEVPNLSFAVPIGKRAVTIQANPIIGVAGFVQQGDIVDVIATLNPPGEEMVTKIVLQDIQVLAVGKTYFHDLSAGKPGATSPAIISQLTDLITLAVTPEQLEKLVFLDSATKFRLVLKNPKDNQPISTAGGTLKRILKEVDSDREKYEAAHGTAASASSAEQATTVVGTVTPPTQVAAVPPTQIKRVDDGKVEIFYGGRKRKEEIYKDGFEPPTSGQFSQPSPNTHSHAPHEGEGEGE